DAVAIERKRVSRRQEISKERDIWQKEIQKLSPADPLEYDLIERLQAKIVALERSLREVDFPPRSSPVVYEPRTEEDFLRDIQRIQAAIRVDFMFRSGGNHLQTF